MPWPLMDLGNENPLINRVQAFDAIGRVWKDPGSHSKDGGTATWFVDLQAASFKRPLGRAVIHGSPCWISIGKYIAKFPRSTSRLYRDQVIVQQLVQPGAYSSPDPDPDGTVQPFIIAIVFSNISEGDFEFHPECGQPNDLSLGIAIPSTRVRPKNKAIKNQTVHELNDSLAFQLASFLPKTLLAKLRTIQGLPDSISEWKGNPVKEGAGNTHVTRNYPHDDDCSRSSLWIVLRAHSHRTTQNCEADEDKYCTQLVGSQARACRQNTLLAPSRGLKFSATLGHGLISQAQRPLDQQLPWPGAGDPVIHQGEGKLAASGCGDSCPQPPQLLVPPDFSPAKTETYDKCGPDYQQTVRENDLATP
ncbi:hypothetical protein LX36DRAFT_672939 [Colletotrichum falcatum]|nr:hypothetical protein LX36DRAFT_672939 [Colletotrichum falcatum]